jgi:hypothetical protein
MDRKQLILVLLLVAGVAAALWLRAWLSPGQVVRRQLAEAVDSVENERILGVMSKISRTYSDQWGNSYESIGGHLQSLMDAYDRLDVDLDVTAVEVGDDEVRLGTRFIVTGDSDGSREAVLGTGVEPCRATLLWRREQPGWRLVETEELDIPELRDELEAHRLR